MLEKLGTKFNSTRARPRPMCWRINDNSPRLCHFNIMLPISSLSLGERLIQFATDNLVIEVLVHPQLYTLQQCMRNMLGSFTKHRHIIHGGYTFAGSGSWVLQVEFQEFYLSEAKKILEQEQN